MKAIFCIVVALCFCNLKADTHTAASCTAGDVQTVIGLAATGDTVMVPAGSVSSWSVTVNKRITLKGAGIGNTVIMNANLGITVNGARITCFTFDGPAAQYGGSISIYGDLKDWRIDNCSFLLKKSGRGVYAQSGAGVIDHCTFLQASSNVGGVLVEGADRDGVAAWSKPADLGTADAVYVEDCTFDFPLDENDSAIDGCFGARVVFRHCKVTGTEVQVHGLCSCDKPPNGRGSVKTEIYDNELIAGQSPCVSDAICIRGGTSVVFNNTMTGNFCGGDAMLIKLYRVCSPGTVYTEWGMCTTYPCLDQPGRAPDADGDGVQDLEPLYEWNNTLNSNDIDWNNGYCAEQANFIKLNRDYYNDTPRPGYKPFTYPHPLIAGQNTTAVKPGVYSMLKTAGSSATVFDIQGRKVNRASAKYGIYIVRGNSGNARLFLKP